VNPNFLRRSLIAVLAAEVCLFAASFGKYFCGDSLYFFSHSPEFRLFTQLDDLSTYRPFTPLIFRYLMLPLGGFNPLPYHIMALAAHMGVTALVYLLLKRVARSEAGVVAGLVFFGLHATGFYISYDATFLPDFSVALFSAGAFLAFATGHRRLSLLLFVAALFCKESAVAIPVGLAVIGYMIAREKNVQRLLPFGIVTGAYLIFQLYLHHGWLYPSDKSAYKFTMGASSLWLKLKYWPWIANLPADWFRQRWWMIPPLLLMIAPLIWIGIRKLRRLREEFVVLALCGMWAFAALAPALPVAQVPMEHNLYVPLIAAAVAISRIVDKQSANRIGLAMACLFVAATAFQVHNDLKTSWVGEGSDITEASIDAVQRAYPVLPPGARFYILPAKIPGGINWYFDDEELFRRVYHDQALRVYYADLQRFPPPGFEQQAGVLIFSYYGGRLYDVTAEYKRAAADRDSRPLLAAFDRAGIESSLTWKAGELLNGRAGGLAPLAFGDDLRQALEVLPKSVVRIPVEAPLPADSVLAVGFAALGKRKDVARGELVWVSGEHAVTLTRVFLEQAEDGKWWDGMLDLSRLAGQSGTLMIRNTGGHDADWLAVSRLAVIPRRSPFLAAQKGNDNLAGLGSPLLGGLEGGKVSSTLAWENQELPGGQAAAIEWVRHGQPRPSLVLLPRTTVRIPLDAVSPGSILLLGVGSVGKQRAEAQGRVLWEADGQRKELARVVLEPGQDSAAWWDDAIDLGQLAGHFGTLVLENKGDRESDWIAWNRLRLVHASDGYVAVEAGARPLRERRLGEPLLWRFEDAKIASGIVWKSGELPGGQAAALESLGDSLSHRERRASLVILPQTTVRIPVDLVSPGTLLLLGVGSVGKQRAESQGRVVWEEDGQQQELARVLLEPGQDAATWWDDAIAMSKFAGHSGTLLLENNGGRESDWIAWNGLRLVRASDGYPVVEANARPLRERGNPLLMDFPRAEVASSETWKEADLPNGRPASLQWLDRDGQYRRTMLIVPASEVRFPVTIPEHSRLRFTLSVTGGTVPASEATIEFRGREFEGAQLFHAYLDRTYDGSLWRPHEVDLSGIGGRTGTLVFRNVGKRADAIVAWSDISIASGARILAPGASLFDLFSRARLGIDLTEDYPNHEDFGTPGGKPAFIWWDNPARPARLSLVTLAGASLSYNFAALPERASLVFAVSHGTGAGDGVRGKIYWNNELLFDRMVRPSERDWSEVVIPLPLDSKAGGTLKIEVSSGPKRNTIGDWLAWSGLRINSL